MTLAFIFSPECRFFLSKGQLKLIYIELKPHPHSKMKTILPIFAALALLPGCASVKTLHITAEGNMAAASVQVDVAPDSPAIQSVPVSQYFLPGNSIRAGAKSRTVRFGQGQPSAQDISVSGLGGKAVVIAQLPGARTDAPGDADSRRKTIPLSGKLPNGEKVTSVLRVGITDGGITVKSSQ
ncbi:MAG: hypothetical protein ABI464_09340 [Chthoniobacteraceae bacterium]